MVPRKGGNTPCGVRQVSQCPLFNHVDTLGAFPFLKWIEALISLWSRETTINAGIKQLAFLVLSQGTEEFHLESNDSL